MTVPPVRDSRWNQPGEAPPALRWRELLLLFLASRILIWMVAGISLATAAKGAFFAPPAGPADWFMRWDAVFFQDIIQHGYQFAPSAESANVVFLPLFPALVYVVSLGGLIDLRIAGHIAALACLWGASVWLWKTVAREWKDARLATLSVAFLLFGPVSFFFSCLYSEALFLPLAIGCIDSARRNRWWLAGTLGALAALTRFIGVVLIVPIAWQWWETYRAGRDASRRAGSFLACFLPAAGFGSFCGFLWLRFGDPLLYFHAEQYRGRHFAWFWDLLYRDSFSHQSLFYQFWFGATIVAAFGLVLLGVLFRLPLAYSVYGLTAGFIYISARLVESLPRYFSVIFPLYVVLAMVATRWPKTTIPLLAASAGLLSLSVVLFVNGYWFT